MDFREAGERCNDLFYIAERMKDIRCLNRGKVGRGSFVQSNDCR